MAMIAACSAAAGLAYGGDLDAELGRALFKRQWVPAPSSTDSSNGLGPLFNARACAACHRDGGGARVTHTTDGRDILKGAVVRFGDGDGRGDPYYGQQLQVDAVPGLEPEGEAAFLPTLKFSLNGPPLAPGVKSGVRVAPPLSGRFSFEEIPDDEILKHADPEDRDHDGIRGRARRLGGPDGPIGRYGWKASHATLPEQIADAFMLDLGLSSPLSPHPWGDCTALQTKCLAAPSGQSQASEGQEISSIIVGLVAQYLRSLPVSEATADAVGQRIFAQSGCAACHVPTLIDRWGKTRTVFSDLLLHDMGHELDDGVGEPGVASSQWRTAPLAGRKGLPDGRYLHDGSAPTLAVAIDKHGGEASAARRKFHALSAEDRKSLIGYLRQL